MTHKNREPGQADQIRGEWFQHLAEFGLLLAQKREGRAISQSEMARRIGTSQSRISRIEMGLGIPKDLPIAQAYAVCYQLGAEETQEWLQLLYGLAPNPQGTRTQQPFVATQPTAVPSSQVITEWGNSVAPQLIQTASNLTEHLLWEDAIPLFRKAETLLNVSYQAAAAACKIAHIYRTRRLCRRPPGITSYPNNLCGSN